MTDSESQALAPVSLLELQETAHAAGGQYFGANLFHLRHFTAADPSGEAVVAQIEKPAVAAALMGSWQLRQLNLWQESQHLPWFPRNDLMVKEVTRVMVA